MPDTRLDHAGLLLFLLAPFPDFCSSPLSLSGDVRYGRFLRQKWIISVNHDYSPYKKDATRKSLVLAVDIVLVYLKQGLNSFSDIYEAQLNKVIPSNPKF